MEVYKSETREVIRRFLNHRLSFHECMAALDAAFADLSSRLTGEQIAAAAAPTSANSAMVESMLAAISAAESAA